MASDLVARLGVDTAAWSAGFNKARGMATGFTSSLSSLLTPQLAALGAGIAGVWGASESVAAFKESLESQRKFSAVLQATGGAAGITTEQMAAYSAELQRTTNFEDDATTATAAVLAAFTNVRGDVFKDTIKSAMDLTTIMGGDLESSVKLLGKALNDPSEGFGKLAKAGIQFTDAEQKQITALQQAGKLTEAQGLILDKVKGKFGGAAEAVADPWTQLKNTVGDVSENIGALLLPSINVVAAAVSKLLGPIAQSGDLFLDLGTTAAAGLSTIGDLVNVGIEALKSGLAPAIEFVITIFTSLTGGIDLSFVSFQNWIASVAAGYENLGGAILATYDQVALFFIKSGAEAAHFFTETMPAYLNWFEDNWQNAFSDAAANSLTVFENLGANLASAWTSILNAIKGQPLKFDWKPLKDGFISTVSDLPNVSPRAVGELEKQLSESAAASFGSLKESFDASREKYLGLFGSHKDSISAKFDVNSKAPGGIGIGEASAIHEGKKNLSNKAILGGSQEAAALTTRGLSGNLLDKQMAVAKEQLEVQKQLLAATKGRPSTGFGEIDGMSPGLIQ